MVLSNKKQKLKLRAAKAELMAASGTPDISRDLGSEKSNSVKTLMNPESQKPTLSKREKRRQKTQQGNSDIIEGRELTSVAEEKKEDELKSDIVEVKKKKKRKRDESNPSENVKEMKAEQPKKKKKKTKKKKKKKPEEKVENGKPKEETREQNASGPSGEQYLAKADESTNRREDAEVPGKVYVGGIPYYSTEDDIRSYFEHCGTITDIDCMKFSDTGKFRGIAIISFKTEAASRRALALDGSDILSFILQCRNSKILQFSRGELFLKIQPFKSAKVNKLPNFMPTVLEGYNRIYVGNLSWDLTEDDLRKLFSECNITSIRFGEDKETGEFKGYGHVDFADGVSLNKALKLDQTIVCGRPVKISCAVPKSGTVAMLKSMPKDSQVSSVKVSAVSEEQNNSTQVESVEVTAVSDDQVNNSATNAVSSKIRRRTCYECGEKGHLSSACPKKLAADVTNTGAV
ncbi:hypothetical protein RD792_001279 [Penstemon davidsonii]|uniref:Protein gar2 n=1 Tax=Penstemon davidsonii TaxID=160366 RepID=A0ABR0DN10_9LAMI|nr:hypothetical protein RD792_001279 [Penstemon davidsonii]